MRRRLVTAAISLHFILILLVACHAEEVLARVSVLRPLRVLVDYYSAITFANRNFGFFAPTVNGDWETRLTMTDGEGNCRPYHFQIPNREMQVRLYSMLGHFGQNDDISDLFARSWGLKAMNENPDVVRVDVEVTQNWIPTMSEYRQGKRIVPEFLYRTTLEAR